MKKWKKQLTVLWTVLAVLAFGALVSAKDYREKVTQPAFWDTITVTAQGNASEMRHALQDAMDQAKESGDQLLRIKLVGNFQINSPLYIRSNTYLDATEATITKVYTSSDTNCNMLSNCRLGQAHDVAGKYDLNKNIWIVGGTFSGGDLSSVKGEGTNICLVHAKCVRIIGAKIQNNYGGHLVELNAVNDALIQDCSFNGFKPGKDSWQKDTLAVQIDMAHGFCGRYSEPEHAGCKSHSSMPKSYKADNTVSNNIRVIANQFNNENTGVGNCARAVGSGKALTRTDKWYHTNIKILGNTVTNSTGSAISVKGYDHFEISGNILKSSADFGISVFRCKNGTIDSNVLTDTKTSGMLFYSDLENITVSNNSINSCKKIGITTNADGDGTMKGVVFSGNTISNVQTGIFVSKKASISKITGNTISNTTVDHGISVNGAAADTISQNTIRKIKKSGVMVTAGGTVSSITGNTIDNTGDSAIMVAKKGTAALAKTISSNKISGAKGHGIYLKDCKKTTTISSNTISGCQDGGIYLYEGGKAGTIKSNTVKSNKNNGISLTGSGTAADTISGNKITGNTGTGIYVSKNAKVQKVTGNTFSGNAAEIKTATGGKIVSTQKSKGSTAAVTKVAATPKKATIGVGETLQLSVSVTPSSLKKSAGLSYASSKKTVATVSSSGKVTGKKSGTTTITVKSKNGKKASVVVTVKKAPSKVTAKPKSLSLKKGKSATLKAVLPSGTASRKLTWSSSNKKVATVSSSGKVTAKNKGTAYIIIKTYNKKQVKVKVTVK